jgi:hypothetical protein
MMLHYHTTSAPFLNNSPTAKEYRQELLERGLVQRDQGTDDIAYCLTSKGRAFVAMLCATPDPVEAWINPLTKKMI